MSRIDVEVGSKIRQMRQSRRMTQDELATAIHKSRATLSKYESGDISIDLNTLYDLSDAFGIHPEQLLYLRTMEANTAQPELLPAFFKGLARFYGYYYDGRNGKLNRSVFDVFSQTDIGQYRIALYMNCSEFDHYQQAENIYWGTMQHFDSMTLITLKHQNNPMERASLQVLASFLDADTRWGLWNGVSSRPLMPVALKFLLSKRPLPENAALLHELKFSKEDIRRMKYYNMFSVV